MTTTEPHPGGDPRGGLVGWVIERCARHLFVLAGVAWGIFAIRHTPLDAIPDLSDVQVIVFTEWPGRSPDLVEDQITYPISAALLSAPHVKSVRGQSYFGLSFVYVVFDDSTDLYWARSRVLEYLDGVRNKLPDGVAPAMGPDATGVGWVFSYALVDHSGRHDLAQLRSLQDWNVRYALESVPGVAEVASVGGFVKEYQIQVDPDRLRAYGVSITEVADAVRASNEDAGGGTVEIAGHEHIIRGRGYIKSVHDLELVPLRATEQGTPVLVRDVAEVSVGPAPRRGFADLDGEGEVAAGIVVMRYGENALDVIHRVKARLAEIRQGLPDGVELEVTYDRSGLIEQSIGTLKDTLIEEMAVVALIIFIFLLHVRSSLVAVVTIPAAVAMAFIPMLYQGLTANIMSLGGIAVAIGAMVDAAIILIENTHKDLELWDDAGKPGSRVDVIVAAMREVGPSIFFSLLVITVSFLPVFTLEGTEGRLFKPLAFTKTYSMGFAALLAITLTPALAALLIRGHVRGEHHNPLNRALVRIYAPVVRLVVHHRYLTVVLAVLAMVLTIPAFSRLGTEFMPPLNEGVILYMPTAPPGMSMTAAGNALQSMDRKIKEVPEVVSVFGKMGRSTTPTDSAPIGMAETTIVLKPKSEWRPGLTWDDLIDELDQKLRYPGMPNVWWMPIQTRTEMLATGVRSPVAVEVFGPDLATIEEAALSIESTLGDVPGTRSAFAERSTGGFYLDLDIDRAAAARYGLRVRDIQDVVRTAIGGLPIGETVEGRELYPIQVRYARDFREDPEALRRVLVTTPAGAQVPLADVADVRFRNGPPMVRTEAGQLVSYVFVDPGEVPVADYVARAQDAISAHVKLPAGTRLSWTGQYRYLERAKARFKVVVPITLALVVLLLFLNTRSFIETGIVMLAVPFSLIGAVWLLYLLDYHLSVAVWVGMIALAGLDAETGVVMLLYLTIAHRRRQAAGTLSRFSDLREAIVEGAAHRIRPKLMTVLTAMIGLTPILWSTGTGADMMKRVAAPMVGGLATSFLLELLVYPALFAIWKGRGPLAPEASEPKAAP